MTNRLRETFYLLTQLQGFRCKLNILCYALIRSCFPFLINSIKQKEIHIHLKSFSFIFKTYTGELFPYFEIYTRKYYDQHENFIAKKDSVVVDIGANIGLYSICQAKRGAQVFSYEANPDVYTRLVRNAKLNQHEGSITTHHNAVHSNEGEVNFLLNPHKSLLGRVTLNDQVDNHAQHIQKIPSTTLDHIWRSLNKRDIDILKLDTEGNEIEILKGGQESLQHIQNIVLEYHGEDSKQQSTQFLTEKYPFQCLLDQNEILYFSKK